MSEIRKTLAILKARWPEVTVIVGLPLLAQFLHILSGYLTTKQFLTPNTLNLLRVLIIILLPVVLTVLRCGFLRTVYLEGQKRQSIWYLLRAGVHFLWRMIVLGALYGIPFVALILISYYIIVRLVSPKSLSQVIPWIYQLYFVAAHIIFIKLLLCIPALVIVLDCRTFDSFRFLKFCRLSKARALIILYCINIAISLFLSILSRYCWGTNCGSTCCSGIASSQTSQYTFVVVSSAVTDFISLMIAVMAVRFTHQCLWTLKIHRNIKAEI